MYSSSARIAIVPFIPRRTFLPHARQPLPITIQIGRTVSDRRLFSRLKRINIQPGRVQKHGFHFAQSGHACIIRSVESVRQRQVSSAYYAIISLTRLSRGITGFGEDRNRRKNGRGEEERAGAIFIRSIERNSHTLDSCTRFAFRNVPLRNAIACCTRCTG